MAEITPEQFVLLVRQALEQQAQERNFAGGFSDRFGGNVGREPGVPSLPSIAPSEESNQFLAFISSSRLWAEAASASNLTDAINILLNDVFPTINEADPFNGETGQPTISPTGIPDPIIQGDLGGFILVRNALTPIDSEQADDYTQALRDSIMGQKIRPDTLGEVGSAFGISLTNLLTVQSPEDTAEADTLRNAGIYSEEAIAESQRTGQPPVPDLLLEEDERTPRPISPSIITPLLPDFASAARPDPLQTTADFLTRGPSPLDLEIAERRRAGESMDDIRSDLQSRREALQRGETDVAPIPSSIPIVSKGIPRYFDNDATHFLDDFSAETISAVQVMLVRAGVLGRDSFRAGLADPETLRGLQEVAGFSNISNQTWFAGLQSMIRFSAPLEDAALSAEGRAGPQSIFTPAAFRAPDPDTLAGQVLDTFNRFLGRDPSPEELAEFMNLLSSDTAAAFNADEKARFLQARATAEAQAEAFDLLQSSEETSSLDSLAIAQRIANGESSTSIFAEIKAAGAASAATAQNFDSLLVADSPGTVEQVDPGATFLNAFRNRFNPEIEARDQFEDKRSFDQAARQSTRNGFLGFLSMIRNNPFSPT